MKKIGIVGGVAWQSTVEYYSEICRRSERRGLSAPEMGIESLDLEKAVSYLGVDGDEESWSRFDAYHRAALQRLEAGGADFALMASNTPHHRLDSIVRGIGIPVIGIFEAVAKQASRMGAREVLILGTSVTMRSPKLREEFAKYGIAAFGPDDESARAQTVQLIMELQRGSVEGTAGRIALIMKTACERQCQSAPTVCLACTELSLAFPERRPLAAFEYDGAMYIDSTAAHIDAVFEFAVAG